ncbi:MAG: geranylgeranylglyceryl/heptaprenylglyceryl phosphate synthase, partial [Fibrobacterota bacterium]
MIGPLEQQLLNRRSEVGPLWAVLLDPDSLPPQELAATAREVQDAGADLLLVGGSSAAPGVFEAGMKAIREQSTLPVVLFPGSYHQVVAGAHGILFTTLLSGRNPQYLAEEQCKGAPRVVAHGIEPIPTAYLLIESGVPTTVQKVSGTQPLARDNAGMDHARGEGG